MVGGVVYLVEVSRNEKKVFCILFPNFEVPEVFHSCVLSEKQA